MIKGIVVEHKKRHTIMMTAEGKFYKAKKINKLVGEEAHFEPVSSNPFSLHALFHWLQNRLSLKIATAFALSLMLAIPFYSWLGQEDVYAYVNIDINPSIELSLNKSYEVIGIEGLNDDGELLLDQLSDWKKKPLQSVSSNILLLSKDMGYLSDDHNLLFGISFVDQFKNSDLIIITDLTDSLKSEFNGINIASFEVPTEYREEAKNENTSMNIVYASQILENESNHDEEVIDESIDVNLEDEKHDENVEKDKQTEQNKTIEDQVERKENGHKNMSFDQSNLKIIEKFLLEADEKDIPPGILKKLEKLGITKEEIEEELLENLEDHDEDSDTIDDIPHKNEGKRNNGNGNEDRGNKGKNDHSNSPHFNKHNGNKENNDRNGKHDQNEEDFVPPGLRDKLDEEGNFVPPGQRNKGGNKPDQ